MLKALASRKGLPIACRVILRNVEKIFDKNTIIDKKFRQIGAGLGLNLSKDIITNHGGQIYAKIIKTSNKYDILEFGFYIKTENSEKLIDYNSAAATALYKLI